MINSTVLVGRLTKDIELRYTPNGLAVARFILAVNRQFAKEGGEREADFISCIAWRKTAENLSNYTKKGSLIGITGRIQTGSYEQDGKRIYTTDVVADTVQFLESRKNSEQSQPSNEQQYNNSYTPPQQQQQSSFNNPPTQNDWGNNQPTGGFKYEDPNDDLPF